MDVLCGMFGCSCYCEACTYIRNIIKKNNLFKIRSIFEVLKQDNMNLIKITNKKVRNLRTFL
jgi:hypothetical protein